MAEAHFNFLWWNLHNLFDDVDDPGSGDPHRTTREYKRDLADIVEIISSMPELPDIFGFAEVEKRRVSVDLARMLRKKTGQAYEPGLYVESNDPRGIDVGFMLRQDDRIRCSSVSAIMPDDAFAVRPILVVNLALSGHPFQLALVHSKSRRSGKPIVSDATPGSMGRRNYGKKLREIAAQAATTDQPLLIMGDFNDEPEDYSIKHAAGASTHLDEIVPQDLYSLGNEARKSHQGTIWYRGKWLMFDQALANGFLLAGGPMTIDRQPKIATHGRLLKNGKPNRWYSDHLPVTARIDVGDLED